MLNKPTDHGATSNDAVTTEPVRALEAAPAPLVDSDVDLRGFPYMPLDVVRLRDSDFTAMATGEEFMAAVLLWCAAWHQIPGGSLPVNDRVLAQLAGYGRDVKRWLAVREIALRGWTLCSDGRLYHRVISQKATESWGSKLKHQYTRFADRARKENEQRKRDGQIGMPILTMIEWMEAGMPPSNRVAEPGIPSEFQRKPSLNGEVREVKGKKEGEREENTTSSKPDDSSRLRVDWDLPKEWGNWALDERKDWTVDSVRHVAAVFKDYWLGKSGSGAVKQDWEATWRNWVRNEGKTLPSSAPLKRRVAL
jgi:Protein of unknown function (DUF1376)